MKVIRKKNDVHFKSECVERIWFLMDELNDLDNFGANDGANNANGNH